MIAPFHGSDGKRPTDDSFSIHTRVVKQRRVERQTVVDPLADQIIQHLKNYVGECMLCVYDGVRHQRHDLFSCSRLSGKKSEYYTLKTKMVYPPNTIAGGGVCKYCHLPSRHGALHEAFGGGFERCPYNDIIVPLMLSMFFDLTQVPAILRVFGREPTTTEAFAAAAAEPHSEFSTRAIALAMEWFVANA